MKKIYAGNLPSDMTEAELASCSPPTAGCVRSSWAQDLFSGKCRGFGFVEMEGHEARAAIAALNGKELRGHPLRVNEERPQAGRRTGARRWR